MTVNLRSFLNMLFERTTPHAQTEIKDVVGIMANQIVEKEPWINHVFEVEYQKRFGDKIMVQQLQEALQKAQQEIESMNETNNKLLEQLTEERLRNNELEKKLNTCKKVERQLDNIIYEANEAEERKIVPEDQMELEIVDVE